jgi:hypothetical protein
VRLIRKEHRYKPQRVHEEIDIPRRMVGRLSGRFLHYTIDSYDQYFDKYLRYTRQGAETLFEQGKTATFRSLCIRPFLRFCQLYLLRGGFLDGNAGLQACMLTAFFNTFVKQARLWELQRHATTTADMSMENADGPTEPTIVPFPQTPNADPPSGEGCSRWKIFGAGA